MGERRHDPDRRGPRSTSGGERGAATIVSRRRGRSFLERTLGELLDALEHARSAEDAASRRGLLQRVDPRVKVVGLFALVLAAVLARHLGAVAGVFAFAVLLALLSRIRIGTLALRAWLPALLFTGPVALPALLTTPGEAIGSVPVVGWEVTAQGARSVALLVGRVETTATLTLLLVLTTSWPHVLKALRAIGVPEVVVVILGMTYRYLFALLESALGMLEARRSRMVGALAPAERRRLAAATAGALFSRSASLSEEVYLAMRSRGFRGEVHVLDDFRASARDWAALAGLLAAAVVAAIWGTTP
jgi:cobalt/nickel transport system permease protein